jgi:hypothetical protein
MLVTLQDARALHYCSRGMREFCERHDRSWEDFVKNGIDTEELSKIDDAMVSKLIAQAEQRNAR